MNINIHLTKSWKEYNNHLNDSSFNTLGTILNKEELNNFKDFSLLSINEYLQTTSKFLGFWAHIYRENRKVYASVDHIRSHPLFYGIKDKNFYLSDDANWVRQQVDNREMDPFSKEEFSLTGYVTGKDTLYKDVKQLQAGEILQFEDNNITLHRYYEYSHEEPQTYDEQDLKQNLHKTAQESIQRLIDYADGRQIVIPLSGGYDSRLIATLLKAANYPNILTFTYGVKGNKEAQYSKAVAEALDLPWLFVEYTAELWQKHWSGDDKVNYQEYGSNLVSLPHVQDWLAVKIMKENDLVDQSAIFVPGHSGDFVAGSHIPKFLFFDLSQYTKKDVINQIKNDHYILHPHSSNIKFDNKIDLYIQTTQPINNIVFADAYEKWDWQERQCKFICNSVRVYEFFQYDWWLPLWDKNFIHFFEELPLKLRNHDWYKEYVSEQFKRNSIKGPIELENASDQSIFITTLKQLLKKTGVLLSLARYIHRKIIPPKNHLLSYARYPHRKYSSLVKKGYISNGIEAYFFLQDLERKSSCEK